MWTDIKTLYRSIWTFALVCPVLFAIPVLVEFAQHVVEMQAGMYVDEAGAMVAEADPLRLQFGFAKTLALFLPGYWFVRYIMFGNDPAKARALEWPAVGLFGVIFAIQALQSWLGLFAPSLAEAIGLAGTPATVFTTIETIALQVLMIYLTAWMVAWSLGNAAINPLRSLAIMSGSFWYALGLFVAGFLPLMVLHYALAVAAVVWLPTSLDWAAMVVDSVVVGFLALSIAGSIALGARKAADRKGVSLLPAPAAASQIA